MDNFNRDILLVGIIAHGFLDFIWLDLNGFVVYLLLINLFYCLYMIQRSLTLLGFFVLSMVHFSKDFIYLTGSQDMYLAGAVVTGSAFCSSLENYKKTQQILNNLLLPITHSYYIACFLFFTYGISTLFTVLNHSIVFNLFLLTTTVTLKNTKPLDKIIIYLAFVHTPLVFYRNYNFDPVSTAFFYCFGLVASIFFLYYFRQFSNSYVTETGGVIISILTAHILLNLFTFETINPEIRLLTNISQIKG